MRACSSRSGEDLGEHIGKDAAGAIVVLLHRCVDSHDDRNIEGAAIGLAHAKGRLLLRLEVVVDAHEVEGRIGDTEFTTSLIPRDGLYLVPIKNMVRLPEKLAVGDEVEISLKFKA